MLTKGLVFAGAIVFATTLFGFRSELREWHREVREKDEREARERRALAAISGPYDEAIRVLAETPRPRPIRMSSHALFTAILLSFWSALVVFIGRDEYRNPTLGENKTHVLIFIGTLEILLWSVVWLRAYLKHKHLVSNGELAIGSVVRWNSGFKGPASVLYEFETDSGQRIMRRRPIYRPLSPRVKVPVFYDSRKPKRHVALCSSFCEVAFKKTAFESVSSQS